MRGRFWAAAVSGVLTLSLLGCGNASSERTATPAKPATGVCNGVAKCHVVAATDVDGDGVRDQVGFVVDTKRHVVVYVKTATGQRVNRGMDVLWFPRGEFYGAAPVDGQPGSELVVGSTMGAHTLWFTTLTMRGDRLERLDPPGHGHEWMIDGAFSFSAGVVRHVENGTVRVTVRQAARNGVRPTFSGTDRTYAWTGNGWRHRSTTRTRYADDKAAGVVGGWHVAGLPRFPEF
jgi:hypothetical protein